MCNRLLVSMDSSHTCSCLTLVHLLPPPPLFPSVVVSCVLVVALRDVQTKLGLGSRVRLTSRWTRICS